MAKPTMALATTVNANTFSSFPRMRTLTKPTIHFEMREAPARKAGAHRHAGLHCRSTKLCTRWFRRCCPPTR